MVGILCVVVTTTTESGMNQKITSDDVTDTELIGFLSFLLVLVVSSFGTVVLYSNQASKSPVCKRRRKRNNPE